MAFTDRVERTPAIKFAFAIFIAALLAIPLLTVYALNYDRQSQSETARNSIAEGWGGPQVIAGPLLVIPYQADATETVTEGGRQVTRVNRVWRELRIAPDIADIRSTLSPERRQRSIYEAVVYAAKTSGRARFALPADLARYGVTADALSYDRAELRFGLSDARGLYGPPPSVSVDGARRLLQPGKGPEATGGSGFFAALDATPLRERAVTVDFTYDFRGNASLTLAPLAGDTRWTVTSPWRHPSFQGGFLPTERRIGDDGFSASWRVGNLALGRSLVDSDAPAAVSADRSGYVAGGAVGDHQAGVTLVSPVDLYSQVNRSVKYGFLFIGFTFMAFLMFDIVGGVRVSAIEYLLVGTGLVLFFVMLLAFAEVIGFTAAYLVAGGAIVALLTAYSAAVLKSRRRAGFIAGLLIALYAVLYVLLSLEAYSLLIGSLLLFAALASVMYLTRDLEWGGRPAAPPTDA
ncbi:cell envelope integrity protein CreD [Sphingomonas sp.]|uniref:cell envelope integrity protein CreD n=1 Tax=Sphingomonas sp. TaxID=28214 RepID=UPI002DD66B46|nr:cell envelope integrity protein CreD [Sphingomonas sp.]